MGCVYKAYDKELNRFIALKVLLAKTGKGIERFKREAIGLARLHHPNIIKVYDIGIEEQGPYFAMEFIEGIPLDKFLEQTPPDIRHFTMLMIKIAKAIDYAHSHNIIHRDLKPANILIDKISEPQIADFGLAKFINMGGESLTETGAILGTPIYMSPEQALTEKVDHLSDIYSLGVVFYEMLSGEYMVNGESIQQMLYQVIYKPPTPLRKHNPKITIDLETIQEKCTAKEPHMRYQSAGELADDLQRFLNGEQILASRASFYRHIIQNIKRHKLPLITAMLALLLPILVIAFINIYQSREIDQKTVLYLQKSQKLLLDNKARADLNTYISANFYLNKALELKSHSYKIRQALLKNQKQLAKIALKQKEYFLVQITINKIRKLGFSGAADRLQQQWVNTQRELRIKHQKFIKDAMAKIAKVRNKYLLQWYVFQIIKISRPYVVEILVAYLQEENSWQRKLAIVALGRLGNNYTKVKGKDSVEWLMELLQKHLPVIKDEGEVEELINSLGWLKDARANDLVFEVRWRAGRNGVLWQKTAISHARIPIEDKVTKSAREFYNRGKRKHGKKDLTGAIADYNQAIRLNFKGQDVYKIRGWARSAQGDLSGAIADYNQAIKLKPKHSALYVYRGLARYDKGDLPGAIADYNQAIRINPKLPLAYINRGRAHVAQGDLPEAITDYNQAIRINPKLPLAYINRGNALAAQGNLPGAIADYNQVIKLNPKHSVAHMNLGVVHVAQGDLPRAIAYYNQAIRINPKLPLAYYNRGLTRHRQEDLTGAITDYTQAIKLQKRISRVNPYCYLLFMGLKRQKGQSGQIKKLDQYVKKQKPSSFGWRIVKFYIGIISEKTLRAVITSNKPKEKRGYLCEFYYYVGMDYLTKGKRKTAKKYLQKCLLYKVKSYIEPDLARLQLQKLQK